MDQTTIEKANTLYTEADDLSKKGSQSINSSIKKFEEAAKLFSKSEDFYTTAKVYEKISNLIVKQSDEDCMNSAKYLGMAAKYHSLDYNYEKAANCNKKAAEIIAGIEQKKYSASIIQYYIQAKNNYGNGGYYSESGEMYQREMHFRMLQHFYSLKLKSCNKKKKITSFFKGIAYWISEVFFLYGESFFRIIISSLMIIFLYGLIYYKFKLVVYTTSSSTDLVSWYDYFYFSIVTFTTLGYGDMTPIQTVPGKFIAASEALVGAVTIALFVFVLSRKLNRR